MTDNSSDDGGGKKKSSKWGKNKTSPESWWKKGDPSPNPKGRPKGSKNQKTIYKEAFEAKVIVNIDGKDQKMTKKELGYHQIAGKSAAGDIKAFLIQKELDEKFEPTEAGPPTPEESAADYHTFKAFLQLREKFKVFSKEQAEEDAQKAAEQIGSEDEDAEGEDDEGEYGEDESE